MFEAIALPPLPIRIGFTPVPRIVMSALTKSAKPVTVNVCPEVVPKVTFLLTVKALRIVVVPVPLAPKVIVVATPKALI